MRTPVAIALAIAWVALPGLPGGTAAAAAGAAEPAATDPAGAATEAELDLVVQTGVRFHPDHTRMVQDRLVVYACDCLMGLVSESAKAGGRPKDGEARYRLLIQHTAAVKVNKGVRRSRWNQNRDFASRFVTADEAGRYQFGLLKWNGSSYTKVDSWQVPYTESHWSPVPADTTSRDLGRLGQEMMLRATPTGVKTALLSRLLPIKMVGSIGPVGEMQTCKVAVANRSPWTLTELEVSLQWPDARQPRHHRYGAKFRLDEALPPGEQKAVTCSGEPLQLRFANEFARPMEMDVSAAWEPAAAK